jgi:hypothetical protein
VLISRRECAALYETYAPQLKRRSQLAALVMISVGAMGVLALGFGVATGHGVLLLCGLVFVGTVTVLAIGSRPMGRNRMLLVKGRVLSLEASTAESGAEVEIAVTSVMRFRPDGLARVLSVPDGPKKLGVAESAYEELRARRSEWEGIELLTGNDWFVLATLESARQVIGRTR